MRWIIGTNKSTYFAFRQLRLQWSETGLPPDHRCVYAKKKIENTIFNCPTDPLELILSNILPHTVSQLHAIVDNSRHESDFAALSANFVQLRHRGRMRFWPSRSTSRSAIGQLTAGIVERRIAHAEIERALRNRIHHAA